MMATHNDMDDVIAHRPVSPYGIQKLNCKCLAHMFYADHGDGEVFNMTTGAGIVYGAERVGGMRDSRGDVGKITGWWRSEVGLVEGLG